jgi:diacylglycerol kinase (ATP)
MARKRAMIIYNPASGRARRRDDKLCAMLRLLGGRGIDAQARATAEPNDAATAAACAVAEGFDIIISYGGDGTVNEVIQGMMKSPGASSCTSLAIWAGGTANVIALDLGLPFDIEPLADVIAAGKTKRVSLGLARSTCDLLQPTATERYFVMFAGIGLDASICRQVSPRLKRKIGQLAFWVSGIKHVFTWQGLPFDISVDGKRFEAAFALVGKGKGYGGGITMTPNARLEDPCFEVFIPPLRSSNFAYLRDFLSCYRGKPQATGATLIKGSQVLACSTQEIWVEADGEVIGALPMRFDVVPDALSLIVR